MITKKELIDKLQKYFLEVNDIEVVTRLLANMMIDMSRVYDLDTLSLEESTCLLFRIQHNHEQLMRFAQDDNPTPLKLENIQKAK